MPTYLSVILPSRPVHRIMGLEFAQTRRKNGDPQRRRTRGKRGLGAVGPFHDHVRFSPSQGGKRYRIIIFGTHGLRAGRPGELTRAFGW